MDQAAHLPHSIGSEARRARLHRDDLQPEAQARAERNAVAPRVRAAAETEARGRLRNAGLFSRVPAENTSNRSPAYLRSKVSAKIDRAELQVQMNRTSNFRSDIAAAPSSRVKGRGRESSGRSGRSRGQGDLSGSQRGRTAPLLEAKDCKPPRASMGRELDDVVRFHFLRMYEMSTWAARCGEGQEPDRASYKGSPHAQDL